jgi:hypothetical protein
VANWVSIRVPRWGRTHHKNRYVTDMAWYVVGDMIVWQVPVLSKDE